MADGCLTDERSEIADRLTVAARSWSRPDAMDARDPACELELLLDAVNELNARRLRITKLEAALVTIAERRAPNSDGDDWAEVDYARSVLDALGVRWTEPNT